LNEQDHMMQQITAALEAKPSMVAPADFSARLMARLPQKPAPQVLPVMPQRSSYGRIVMLAMLAVMMAAMVFAASIFGHSTAWTIAEDVLFLQFGALTLWFVLSRRLTS
jgi:hypothetical protein